MSSIRHITSQLVILFSVLAIAIFAIAGCGSGSAGTPGAGAITSVPPVPSGNEGSEPAPPSDSGSQPAPAPPADQGTFVTGQVVYRDTGQPYPGAIVEFKNLYGGNVHTTTDADGHYTLELPPDTYTALALDENNFNEGFDVVGRADNAVTVPPSTTINFVAYAIT